MVASKSVEQKWRAECLLQLGCITCVVCSAAAAVGLHGLLFTVSLPAVAQLSSLQLCVGASCPCCGHMHHVQCRTHSRCCMAGTSPVEHNTPTAVSARCSFFVYVVAVYDLIHVHAMRNHSRCSMNLFADLQQL